MASIVSLAMILQKEHVVIQLWLKKINRQHASQAIIYVHPNLLLRILFFRILFVELILKNVRILRASRSQWLIELMQCFIRILYGVTSLFLLFRLVNGIVNIRFESNEIWFQMKEDRIIGDIFFLKLNHMVLIKMFT